MSSERKVAKTRTCIACKQNFQLMTAKGLKDHFKACTKRVKG